MSPEELQEQLNEEVYQLLSHIDDEEWLRQFAVLRDERVEDMDLT